MKNHTKSELSKFPPTKEYKDNGSQKIENTN